MIFMRRNFTVSCWFRSMNVFTEWSSNLLNMALPDPSILIIFSNSHPVLSICLRSPLLVPIKILFFMVFIFPILLSIFKRWSTPLTLILLMTTLFSYTIRMLDFHLIKMIKVRVVKNVDFLSFLVRWGWWRMMIFFLFLFLIIVSSLFIFKKPKIYTKLFINEKVMLIIFSILFMCFLFFACISFYRIYCFNMSLLIAWV